MRIVNHCSDSLFGNAALIDYWHRERGFTDGIGYHGVILNGRLDSKNNYHEYYDGLFETGHPFNESGVHVRGKNKDTFGLCMIGKDKFSEKQFQTLFEVCYYLESNYPIDEIVGHNELDSKKTCPNFDMNLFRLNYRAFKNQKIIDQAM